MPREALAGPGGPARSIQGWRRGRFVPLLGVVFAELLDLDRLASRCAVLDRYEFMFISIPLAVPGGLSSPANAMALL